MKKIIKKSISVILCLCVISCVPAFASAEKTTVEYGSYPQSLVTDEATVNSLNQLNAQFVSYGYYYGEDETIGTSQMSDYMKYADVEFGGTKYRGVVFSSYRPNLSYMTADTEHSYQDDYGYEPNTVYWFKFEPVSWKILNAKSGLCITEKIIDSQAFCAGFEYDGNMTYYSDSNRSHLANEYAYSKISSWISGSFSSDAFSAEELSGINADNGSKVYLLNKAKTEAVFADEESRKAVGTDYAKCQGLFVNNSWMLADSDTDDTDGYEGLKIKAVKQSGAIGKEDIFSTSLGIRPAAMIDSVIPEYTVKWCADGKVTEVVLREDASIVKPEDPVKEGHTFKGWDKTVPQKMGTKNLEFNAVFEKNTYKITWNMYGQQKTVNVLYGDPVKAPSPTDKPYYLFRGWDAEIPEKMPAKDLVFNAKYEEAQAESISIKKAPEKRKYNYKDSAPVSLDGIEIEASYKDGSKKIITDKSLISVKGFDTASTGTKKIVVEYQGCEAQYTVNVSYTWWQQIIRILLLGFLWY